MLLRHKKNIILSHVTTWMNLEDITLRTKQRIEEVKIFHYLTDMWNLEKLIL